MPDPLTLHDIGRLPAPGDNVAIAIRQIQPGTSVLLPEGLATISHTVLEGHRFAVQSIATGDALNSWKLPFGHATRSIAPGDTVCNDSTLQALRVRQRAITLPDTANFADHLVPFELNEAELPAPATISPATERRTFQGFRRSRNRGVGTRNTIVILGTTSRTASFARQLTARLQSTAKLFPGIDGVVAIAHTEGGEAEEPNNAAEILRALAGFMIHPNVGAVLAVDYGEEAITNARLETFMRDNGYPLDEVTHQFLSIDHGLAAALATGEETVRQWLPNVAALTRSAEPLSELRIALQCGGSDAFSGISGNPLAGALTHEIVRHGGIGVLCETDEIVGAEDHLMRNIKSAPVAHALLDCIANFKERMSWHGVTPEANPSAGNKFRGLYNIALKSLGAVQKKDPRTPLDHVIDYAEPLNPPGYYFMDSPGNDLEAIGGQVGAGCNLIVFITGNGSVTNFPFVPTLKITTTTRRHQLLINEMDINAGRYLDGESLESLTDESLNLLIATASGQRSKGELAGHSQSSLWRNWQQQDGRNLQALRTREVPSGQPLIPSRDAPENPIATERVGLVLPTSMCSSQIARMAVNRLNDGPHAAQLGLSRFVALPHSEGCGFGGETMYRTLCRTYHGYATHPNVSAALLLEHGCEKIPNDVMRRYFETAGLPLDRFGWASVQLDGGIDQSITKVESWFSQTDRHNSESSDELRFDLAGIRLALLSASVASAATAKALCQLTTDVLDAGGSILLPESDPLLANTIFRDELLQDLTPHATLANGEALKHPGLHVVQTDSDHWVENLTSLGACGSHLVVGLVGNTPQQGHPLIPVLQLAEFPVLPASSHRDVDTILNGHDSATTHAQIKTLLQDTLNESHTPIANQTGFVDFQFARGPLGVST
ncbi:MAG: UxaA family hydrolase [Opitutaceae bacterium]|tara:strand:+ start:1582 stop:4257 length:2676 start_codon:yes stop_codon:yes gene_type:complete